MFEVTDEEFHEAVALTTSIAGLLDLLGRARVGTNYELARKTIKELEADTSHWSRAAQKRETVPWSEILIEDSPYVMYKSRKMQLLEEGLLANRCAECDSPPEWRGKPMTLRLDHINGKRNDHRIENLRMLCPNCDSQTDTFCGRNSRKPARKCPDCGTSIRRESARCRSCAMKFRHSKGLIAKPYFNGPRETKITWPSIPELEKMIRDSSFVVTAAKLGVSDNAIRKRLKKHGGHTTESLKQLRK